jgi:hypothetical protein
MTACNEYASYGKFKPANVEIGNVEIYILS